MSTGKILILIGCLLSVLLVGCAKRQPTYTEEQLKKMWQTPKYDSQVTPVRPAAETPQYTIKLAVGPKDRMGLHESFILTVHNKTAHDLVIDWNSTLFIQNNATSGGFMYAGIVYRDRNQPKPPEIVFPGATITKAIYPNENVFWSSFSHTWQHGELTGETGAYLALKVDGKPVREKLLVKVVNTKLN